MFITHIYGLEMDIQKSDNFADILYFSSGKFVGEKVSMNVEPMQIKIKCDPSISIMNFYFNPNTYKISMLNENIDTPHAFYGYHMGGITLQPENSGGRCRYKFLSPNNDGVTYHRGFTSSYDCAYDGDASICTI